MNMLISAHQEGVAYVQQLAHIAAAKDRAAEQLRQVCISSRTKNTIQAQQ